MIGDALKTKLSGLVESLHNEAVTDLTAFTAKWGTIKHALEILLSIAEIFVPKEYKAMIEELKTILSTIE